MRVGICRASPFRHAVTGLVEAGANLSVVNEEGMTALELAEENGGKGKYHRFLE